MSISNAAACLSSVAPNLKERGGKCVAANLPSHVLCLYLQESVHTLQLLCNHLVPLQDSKNSRPLCACAIFRSCKLKEKKKVLFHKDTTWMHIFCVNGHNVPSLFSDAPCCICTIMYCILKLLIIIHLFDCNYIYSCGHKSKKITSRQTAMQSMYFTQVIQRLLAK